MNTPAPPDTTEPEPDAGPAEQIELAEDDPTQLTGQTRLAINPPCDQPTHCRPRAEWR